MTTKCANLDSFTNVGVLRSIAGVTTGVVGTRLTGYVARNWARYVARNVSHPNATNAQEKPIPAAIWLRGHVEPTKLPGNFSGSHFVSQGTPISAARQSNRLGFPTQQFCLVRYTTLQSRWNS